MKVINRHIILNLVFGMLMIVLTSCSSLKAIEIYTLDRKAVVDELAQRLPEETAIPVSKATNVKFNVLIDNREAMRRYLPHKSGETLYSEMLASLGGDRLSYVTDVNGYFLTDLLSSNVDNPPLNQGHSIFERARESDSYRSNSVSDWGSVSYQRNMPNNENWYPLSDGLTRLLSDADILRSNQLFIVVSNLAGTTELDTLFDAVNLPFANRRNANIGMFALKSEYWGDITDALTIRKSTHRNNPVPDIPTDDRVIRAQYLNNGNGINRPVYVIVMGDAKLVKSYMNDVERDIRSHSLYQDRMDYIKTLLLDEFPLESNPIVEIKPDIVVEELGKFVLANESKPSNINAIFSSSYDGGRWDDYIGTGEIPFWRVWRGIEIPSRFSIKVNLPDGGRVQPLNEDDISLHLFSTDETQIGTAIKIKDDGNNVNAQSLKTSFDENGGNKYINIGRPSLQNNMYEIPLTIHSSFEKDKPLVFLLQGTFLVDRPSVPFTGQTTPEWVGDWNMELSEYVDYAYPTSSRDGSIFIGRTSYSGLYLGAEKTLFLSDFVEKLLRSRQKFIHTHNVPSSEPEPISWYCIFGFVSRDTYSQDLTNQGIVARGMENDDGLYAFPATHSFD